LAAGFAALALSFGAHATIIDLFSTDQGPYQDINPNSADTGLLVTSGVGGSVGLADPTILGGNRDMFVSLLDNNVGGAPLAPTISRSVTMAVGGGVMDFSTNTLTAGRGQIQWDGANATNAIDFTGLGGINLGTGNILLDIIFSDAGFNFHITIYTDATHWTDISFTSSAHSVPATTAIPLAAFSNAALCGTDPADPGVGLITCGSGGAANTANVGAIVADIDPLGGSTSIDLTLDSVTTVPEPGTLALLGLGLLGLGFGGLGRRRNSVSVA